MSLSTTLTHVMADDPKITNLSQYRADKSAQMTCVKVRGYIKSRRLGYWDLWLMEGVDPKVQATLASRFKQAVDAGKIFTGVMTAERFSPYHNSRMICPEGNELVKGGFKEFMTFIHINNDADAQLLDRILRNLGY